MKVSFSLNGQEHTVDEAANTPLLWIIRDVLGQKGTKFGCGKGACGACTVNINGMAIRSCSYPIAGAANKEVLTIEGLAEDHPVKKAWTEYVVPQCGYCQPGFMMATNALLERVEEPSDEDIDSNITNVCRCATYYRMKKAIHRAIALKNQTTNQ